MPKMERRCPCGDIILADTEDWPTPLCYECYPKHLVDEVDDLKLQIKLLKKTLSGYT